MVVGLLVIQRASPQVSTNLTFLCYTLKVAFSPNEADNQNLTNQAGTSSADVEKPVVRFPAPDRVLRLGQSADRSVQRLHHPVLLLQETLVALQVDESLGVQTHSPALLVPLVVDIDPVL